MASISEGAQRLQRRFAETVRPHFKSTLWTTVQGYLCESEVFERLRIEKIPFVRSWESSPIDGAFICPGPTTVPLEYSTSLSVWQWALQQKDVEFIPFDVKTVSLHSSLGSIKNLDYTFSRPRAKSQFNRGNAEVFLLKFEEFENYTAIVPKAVYESASGVAYGINGLISGVPCIWHPYMVHDSQLRLAIDSLMNSNEDYTNPTTGVTFTGFRPLKTKSPAIIPTNRLNINSMAALCQFFDDLQGYQSKLAVDLNPIAPLVGDFVVRVPGLEDLICIEHKYQNDPWLSKILQCKPSEIGRKSPWAKTRMWHFLIFQMTSAKFPNTYACFGRHEVESSWAEIQPKLSDLSYSERYLFRGENAVGLLLAKIEREAAKAVHAVDKVIRDLRPHDNDIASLVTGNHMEDVLQLSQQIDAEVELEMAEEQAYLEAEFADDDGKINDYEEVLGDIVKDVAGDSRPVHMSKSGNKYHKVGGLLWNSVGLHWMCNELNKQCCKHGRMICFPLDHGHALGDHVLVDYQWSEQDKAAFEDNGKLPRYVFSPKMQDTDTIALRFADFSWTGKGSKSYPLWITGRYWTRPAIRQHFMFIASVLHGTTKEEAGSHYLLYPSQFTTIFRQGCRDAPRRSGHRGELYFRNVLSETNRLPEPDLRRRKRFDRNTPFIPDEAPSPIRCILDLDDHSIYLTLLKVMDEEQPSISISNPQSNVVAQGFSTKLHKTKLSLIWKIAWDFGLSRRAPSIKRMEEIRERRQKAANSIPEGMEMSVEIEESEGDSD